jgi:hypothetical protein
MSSKKIQGTTVSAGIALIVAMTLTAGPAHAKRPDLQAPGTPETNSAWDGEQNMAKRHEQMTVAWRLGLGG